MWNYTTEQTLKVSKLRQSFRSPKEWLHSKSCLMSFRALWWHTAFVFSEKLGARIKSVNDKFQLLQRQWCSMKSLHWLIPKPQGHKKDPITFQLGNSSKKLSKVHCSLFVSEFDNSFSAGNTSNVNNICASQKHFTDLVENKSNSNHFHGESRESWISSGGVVDLYGYKNLPDKTSTYRNFHWNNQSNCRDIAILLSWW